MTTALHESYKCHCQHPSPLMHLGEDSGLCTVCNGVYDERLYEMRLRKYTPDFNTICGHPDDGDNASVHDYLMMVSPHYRSLF